MALLCRATLDVLSPGKSSDSGTGSQNGRNHLPGTESRARTARTVFKSQNHTIGPTETLGLQNSFPRCFDVMHMESLQKQSPEISDVMITKVVCKKRQGTR